MAEKQPMSESRKIALGVAIGLLVLLAWQNGYLSWLPVGEVKIAAIIGESSSRATLTQEQIHVLQLAPDAGVFVLDRDVLDRSGQPPVELVPLLDAVKGETEYKLVILRTSGKVNVHPLPDSPAKLEKIVR